MGGKSSPPPPDYTGAAREQAVASKENTAQQTYANRPTLNTPWGGQTWTNGTAVDPSTGQPVTTWESSISLSPQQQAALDSQMAIQAGRSSAAQDMLGRATGATAGPIDYSGISRGADRISTPQFEQVVAPDLQAIKDINFEAVNAPEPGSQDWRGMAQEAALGFNKPLQAERRAALEGQLANMGLPRGSAAWNSEMRRLSDQETRDNLQVYDTARSEARLMGDQAVQKQGMQSQRQGMLIQQREAEGLRDKILAGRQDMQVQRQAMLAQQQAMQINAGGFNQQLRQQEIAEMLAKRGVPLNELNALLTGQQVQTPQMPTFNTASKSETPQLLGAAQNQYSAALGASNAQNAATGNMIGGIAEIGAGLMTGGASFAAPGWSKLFTGG